MSWNGKDGGSASVMERGFTVECEGRVVPGVYWSRSDEPADRLVLLGHGGTTHKKVDYIENIARALCRRGLAAMAIDGPGHGDRAPAQSKSDGTLDDFDDRWSAGGGTESVVADWSAALDFIEAEFEPRPTGWWGLSMGTMMGLPVAASDSRIRVAVLGLMGGWGPNGDDLTRIAPDLSIPVRFLVQWHDEIVPRQACLDLFDSLGSVKKTLHANPGLHSAVPSFEVAASVDYLDRYLS